ncbi:MAG: lyase family protein [Nitrososphaerota archaeon]
MDPLEAITPIDGRYREKLSNLKDYFSEYALIKERVRIEIEYLAEFIEEVEYSKSSLLPNDWREILLNIYRNFSLEDARKVKEFEKKLGHDVFAVVKYLMEKFDEKKLEILKPYIHIGLTSEDVNNLAYSSLLNRFNREVLVPVLLKLVDKLSSISLQYVDTVMLGRTHGVPAVPTTFGRFIVNYAYRIAKILEQIADMKFPGKLGGAVGDHNALKFVYPEVDWISFSKSFVESQGLIYFPATTQILPHEILSSYLMEISILDSILSNLCRDIWMLSLIEYVSFPLEVGEVHSSTMPHKSNPILLENAEGAFDLASSILSYMSTRLISSRLHRDLSDSVVKRFYGVPLSLTYMGVKNLLTILDKMQINKERMALDVEKHPEILSEAFQLYLRRHGHSKAYEIIQRIVRERPEKIIEELESLVPAGEIEKLAKLKPIEYLGEAERIVMNLIQEVEKIKSRIEDYRGSL